MNGGEISDNEASMGGGVSVKDSIFRMTGGNVLKNTANDEGGGIYMVNSDTVFRMTGGTIYENTAATGGGVHVGGGSFTMVLESSLTSIRNNTATKQGGGVNVKDVFTMGDGTAITGNTGGIGGGGVYVESGGRFKMSSPSSRITGNKVENPNGNGGGVYTAGRFAMEDGSISGNSINPKAETYEWQNGDNGDRGIGKGCGVYVYNGGTFIKTDGTIHGLVGKGEHGEDCWENADFQNYYGMKVYNSGSSGSHEFALPFSDGFALTPGGAGKGYAVYFEGSGGSGISHDQTVDGYLRYPDPE
jgi:hypothetical protein